MIDGNPCPRVRSGPWSETHSFAKDVLTPAYKSNLFQLIGTVNNAPLKGFAAGEVLLLGALSHHDGVGDNKITFTFLAILHGVDHVYRHADFSLLGIGV